MNQSENYDEIFTESEKFKPPLREKNIFSIGGRGHYENPISDILAFFCDHREEHRLSFLFLKSLFDCLEISGSLEIISEPKREERTDDGNRIDLIIEGEKWVLVIENKIFHMPSNPFPDYEKFIDKKYKDMDKEKYYILLAPYEINQVNWRFISYKKFINSIKNNIGTYLFKANIKWINFLIDFICNIENQIGVNVMDNAKVLFIDKNYDKINNLINMRQDYIIHIQKEILTIIKGERGLDGDEAYMKQHNWGEAGIALRFYHNKWGTDSNIVILLTPDGNKRIQFYIYDIKTDADRIKADEIFKFDKYNEAWTESSTIRGYGYNDIKELKDVFGEFKNVVEKYNFYYSITLSIQSKS